MRSGRRWWKFWERKGASQNGELQAGEERPSGLHGLGEAHLREVLALCGLGPEESGEKRGEERRGSGRGGRGGKEEEVRYAGLGGDTDEGAQRDVCIEGVYSVP